MAKRMNIKVMKIKDSNNALNDDSRVPISFLIPGNALIDLRGRRTLNTLKALRFAPSINGKYSIKLIIMTKKSSQFQGSRRYEFLCIMKPMAMILMLASIIKVNVKYTPD